MSSTIESRLELLEREVQRLREEREIQNFFGRHLTASNQKQMPNQLKFFALDEPDVSLEEGDRGRYVGAAALKTLFQDQWGSSVLAGNLLFPMATTPMLAVADDGKTARGVWRVISAQAVVPKEGFFADKKGTGEPEPLWLIGAYGVDFIKKPDGWKILHLHWFRTTKCGYFDAWVKPSVWTFTGALPNSPDLEPTTYYNPYTPDSIQDSIPGCPKPYATYDGRAWMQQEQSEVWGL